MFGPFGSTGWLGFQVRAHYGMVFGLFVVLFSLVMVFSFIFFSATSILCNLCHKQELV